MEHSIKSQISKDFGRKITLLRNQLGMTQKELAAKSGVPLTAIRRCEQKGQIPLERYLAIISSLGAGIHVTLREKPKKKVTPDSALQPNSRVNRQQMFDKISRKKEAARETDQSNIVSGIITPDELQEKYSIVPTELAKDPAWKRKRIAQAIQSMNRPPTKATIPDYLLRKSSLP